MQTGAVTDSTPATGRRYASLKDAAEYVGVTTRTIRTWISEGLITGYRINQRLVRVDLNELDQAMEPFGGSALNQPVSQE
ncbi:AlpA family transcriptional regulator [Mycobacterium sp. PSTR-4-N]|uniref:helix-turn-helix transcriptional regulator n=1 Tax=Mycobacterium sp. PSTR-4-N TaxID=2917745 RepID=UPI001F14DA92|nr:helix-turn-helix domain-containing protein [Mycobacterium sp. PSTR-4-N]MCG7593729.1 excisionase family DNA-binding protein [Mycobacterium sp. PSTR-4-N]